ncbi:MAG: hypothetical protein L0Y57_07885, partial [Beijerinckiaceae bacterium]|nr:hypothetical protein [Beijerinckiaceae bacterium]
DRQDSGLHQQSHQATAFLTAVAKLVRSDVMNSGNRSLARAELARKLDQLDLTILEAAADGDLRFKGALTEFVAGLRAWRQSPILAGSSGEPGISESRGEATALELESAGAGRETTYTQEEMDRFWRELYRFLTQIEAAKSSHPAATAAAGKTFTRTIPAASANQGSRDLLLKQVEYAQQRLATQLEAGLAATAKAVDALSSAVSGAVKEIDTAFGLARRQQAVAALEAEPDMLAQCVDGQGGGFASLAAIERSLRGISQRLEETHQLISSNSKLAEQDQARTPMSQEAGQTIIREIASLRSLHEQTAGSASLDVTAIKDLLEKLAGSCARLEAAAKDAHLGHSGTRDDPSDPFEPIFTRLTQKDNESTRALNARGSGHAPASSGTELEDGDPATFAQSGMSDAAGFLLEPGVGFPGRREGGTTDGQGAPRVAVGDREEGPSRSDFIAAARRAARTAQMELQGAATGSLPGHASSGGRRVLLLGHGRDFFFTHKVAVLIAAALMLALLGALVTARPLVQGGLIDFLPRILKPFQAGASDGKRSSVDTAPAQISLNAQESAEKTVVRLPPSLETVSGPPAVPDQATGAAKVAGVALDPLAQPGHLPSLAGSGGKTSPAVRAIAGSDAIVAGAMQPAKPVVSSAPGRRPVPAPRGIPAAPLGEAPVSAFGGGTGGPAAAASPNARPESNLTARAEAGDVTAQFELAARHAEGSPGAVNLTLAAQWYEKAAQQGHAVAAYRLASLYEKGHGVAKSMERAKALYQRAAEKGNIRAMHNLGVLAADGNDGKPNYTSAALWFGKAAEFGIRDSQYNLAVLLARGLGVTKDFVKSYTWFAIVAAAGDADAANKRNEVAAKLTSSEIAAANSAAASFAPSPADRTANDPMPPAVMQEATPAQDAPAKPKVSGL